MKTLVVGLGNPILGDDGVGWKVAEAVETQLANFHAKRPTTNIDVDCVALGGLSLMERMVGYERAIVIDSIGSGQHAPGEVYHFDLDELYDPSAGHTTAVHDMSLMTALKLGRSLGAELPTQITVVAVESPYTYDFTEELTPPVQAAVPVAAQTVIDLLSNQSTTKGTKNHEDNS
ncbi:MAG: hydrogenase maturation protease [Chloroflexi bacterium]|nr:hydrogenase maturation protease [Chloroflexota bacterium]